MITAWLRLSPTMRGTWTGSIYPGASKPQMTAAQPEGSVWLPVSAGDLALGLDALIERFRPAAVGKETLRADHAPDMGNPMTEQHQSLDAFAAEVLAATNRVMARRLRPEPERLPVGWAYREAGAEMKEKDAPL